MYLVNDLACNSSTDYSGSVTNSLPHDASTGIKGEIKVAAGGARGEAFPPSFPRSFVALDGRRGDRSEVTNEAELSRVTQLARSLCQIIPCRIGDNSSSSNVVRVKRSKNLFARSPLKPGSSRIMA